MRHNKASLGLTSAFFALINQTSEQVLGMILDARSGVSKGNVCVVAK